MKVSTLSEMIHEYEIRPLDYDDLEKREKLLGRHEYSVIFEGEFMEFDNAVKWLKVELSMETTNYIFYGKLGYDYGFFEFFFSSEIDANKFANILPNIFTKYPNGSIMKSNGLDNYIYQAL